MPRAPVTASCPCWHHVPDHTAEMLYSVPACVWPEPWLEMKEQKNQGAKAINLGSQNSPAGTLLAHEQIGSILIVHIYKINLTYGHIDFFFIKKIAKVE